MKASADLLKDREGNIKEFYGIERSAQTRFHSDSERF